MAYSKEEKEVVFEEIFKRISEGEALRNILKDSHLPDKNTFYIWIDDDESKSEQYVRACEDRQDKIFEEMFDIADDGTNDFTTDKEGNKKVNSEHIQRSKLRIDTRKWALSKLNPKKYGDKVDVTTQGEKINEIKSIELPEGQTLADFKKEIQDGLPK